MTKVFLGGTCNGSQWREKLIPELRIDHFNPVVADWTPEAQQEEIRQLEACDFCLYVLTPKLLGFYAVAEIVDDSNKRPGKTLFTFLEEDEGATFEAHQAKSLRAVGELVARNGGHTFQSLDEARDWLNAFAYHPA